MAIERLGVTLFKGFKRADVKFVPGLNLLVGANNSGKSSLLQALYLAFYFLNLTGGISETDKKQKGGSRLRGATVRSVPLPLHEESYLAEGLKKRSRRDDATSFSLYLDGGLNFQETLTFPGGNLLAISSDLRGEGGTESYRRRIKKLLKSSRNFPLLIPSFGGVTNKEEVKKEEVVKHYITLGKSSEVLRNQLGEMRKAQRDKLNEYLRRSFSVEIADNDTKEIYLSSLYRDSEYDGLDISSAGSGFQQVLQILVYIVTSEAETILVDEPDAHLHYRLQNQLYDILQDLAGEGRQIIVATHSQVFIQRAIAHGDNLVLVNRALDVQKPLDQYVEGVKGLYAAGIVDENEVTKGASLKLIDLEDEDGKEGFEVMKEFLSRLGFREPEFRTVSAGSHIFGYVAGKARLDNLELKTLIIRDSDSVPQECLEKIEQQKNNQNLHLAHLYVHEVENHLINAEAITRVLKEKGVKRVGASKVTKLIEKVATDNRDSLLDDLERPLEDAFTKHYRDFGLKDYPAGHDAAKKRRQAIRDNDFLYPFLLLPGKELFAFVKAAVHSEYKVSITAMEIARAISKKSIPQDIKAAVKFFE